LSTRYAEEIADKVVYLTNKPFQSQSFVYTAASGNNIPSENEIRVKQVTGVEDAPYPAMQVGIPNQPLTHHQYF